MKNTLIEECAFCNNPEVKNRIVAENNFAFAFPSKGPIIPGHMLVCPKRHILCYEELSAEEKAGVEELREKVKTALKKTFGAEGFNYAWNEELVAGQSVPHFHLHIVPRKEGDAGVHQFQPTSFLYRPGTEGLAPAEEIDQVANLIRSSI